MPKNWMEDGSLPSGLETTYPMPTDGFIISIWVGAFRSLTANKTIGYGWKSMAGYGQLLRFGPTFTETTPPVGSICCKENQAQL